MVQSSANRLFYPPPVAPAEHAKAKAYVHYIDGRFGVTWEDHRKIWNHYLPIGDRLLERSWRHARPRGAHSKPWLYTAPVVEKSVAKRHLLEIHNVFDRYGVPRELRSEYLKAQFIAVAMSVHRGIAELEALGHLGGSTQQH
jgi:hypothetical protein